MSQGGVEYHVHAFKAAEPTYVIRVLHPAEGLRHGWIMRPDAATWVRNDRVAYSVDPQTSNSAICIDRRHALALVERWGGQPDEIDRLPALPTSDSGRVLDWLIAEFGTGD